MHGIQTKEGCSSLGISEDPSATKGELHLERININQLKEDIKIAESYKANAEMELSDARKTVKDLASRIEESNSRVTKIERLDEQKRLKVGLGLTRRKTDDGQYAEVTRELENIEQEVSKLKLDIAYVLEEKKNAESEIEASSFMFRSYTSLAEELRKNIDELNEEHVLVALARIEALKEYTAIEAERKEEEKKFFTAFEETRKKVNDLNEEAAIAEEAEKELAVTTGDVIRLKSELALIEGTDIRIQENSKNLEDGFRKQGKGNSMWFLHTKSQESEVAKELAAINEEGFQLMSSMDIIREELKQLAKEKARLRKTEEKAELTIQSVNLKLLRAKSKLEALYAAEEKANSMSSSLAGTLKHLRAEAEAAKKERALHLEATAKVKAEVLRTESEIDLDEAKLQASIEGLRAIKSSEAMALETLKTLVDISMKARATMSHHKSTITISTFEYEYLKWRAVEAKKVADKKVEAAQAWTEALRTSEKQIFMETMITQRKIGEIGELLEEEAINFGRKPDKSLDPEEVQFEDSSSRKSLNRYNVSTPARRPRFRRSGSPAGFYMSRSSITVDRRRKGVQNLSNFFSSDGIGRNQ
ncbi:protein PLASTID MOVEMENT IMPAIRED 2 [Heracleum sosnowskyi]|uniref:Protein PLASTID MOVEMENT IMPAIRED 2 n=1 Tax=Heracleum sosnowskyi TaxID=360622 RepID=A0AAD8J1I8_9APIA|nr:protein PLASTID MOVEMENT IMPAIRED 2 [Heracleum sosnowskyi]